MRDPEADARASLYRSLAIYALLLAADVAVLYYIAANAASGAALITFSIVGIVGLLLGYQVVQHYRDLRVPLAESEGVVVRMWRRADLIVAMHSYYVTVERRVFRLSPTDYVHLEDSWKRATAKEAMLYVKVVHFPYTFNVVSIHEIVGTRPPPLPKQ